MNNIDNSSLEQIQNIANQYKEISNKINIYNQASHIIEFQTNLSKINKPFKNIQKLINNPISDFNKKLNDFKERVEELYRQTPKNLLTLSFYGWYLDFETTPAEPIELGNKINDGDIDFVNEYLHKYYTHNLDNILSHLISYHPERKEIFNQIIEAHKQGYYYISIPAIFAQIDGICFDFTKKKFFMKNNRKKDEYLHLPEITHELKNISNITLKSFLSPIYSDTPIFTHTSNLDIYPIYLNRHEILHGVDKEYGTEINSLKCISLLKYLSDILIRLSDKTEVL